jgi:hypothetical protein
MANAAPLAEWELPAEFATPRGLMEARMLKTGRRGYVQVLRLLETFGMEELHTAIRRALQPGAVGFDAVKHLVPCQVEKRSPRLDLDVESFGISLGRVAFDASLPRATVATARGAGDMARLSEAAQRPRPRRSCSPIL